MNFLRRLALQEKKLDDSSRLDVVEIARSLTCFRACFLPGQAKDLVRKNWQTGSFKACQTAFRTEFGERRAPSKCSIQKLVKKLETRGSRSNACRLLSLGPIEGQSVQKYTPHNQTTQKTLYAKRFKPSTSTLWEKYSRIWRNAFKCAWM